MAAAAVVALLAASCSSGSGSSSSSTTKASGSAMGGQGIPTQSVDSKVASLVPAAVKAAQPITIATDANYPPNEFTTGHGEMVGMDIDLGKALLQVMGLKGGFKNVTFDSIIPAVEQGTYAMGIASFTDDHARDRELDFVNYFQAGEAFYVKAGSTKQYSGLTSLCGSKVAVETGTVEEEHAKAQQAACSAEGKPALTVLSFPEEGAVNGALMSGEADVAYADSPVVAWRVAKQRHHGQIEQSGDAFDVAPYGIALPKGNGMATAVKAGLERLIANGTYAKILAKWGLSSGAIQQVTIDVKGKAAN